MIHLFLKENSMSSLPKSIDLGRGEAVGFGSFRGTGTGYTEDYAHIVGSGGYIVRVGDGRGVATGCGGAQGQGSGAP